MSSTVRHYVTIGQLFFNRRSGNFTFSGCYWNEKSGNTKLSQWFIRDKEPWHLSGDCLLPLVSMNLNRKRVEHWNFLDLPGKQLYCLKKHPNPNIAYPLLLTDAIWPTELLKRIVYCSGFCIHCFCYRGVYMWEGTGQVEQSEQEKIMSSWGQRRSAMIILSDRIGTKNWMAYSCSYSSCSCDGIVFICNILFTGRNIV